MALCRKPKTKKKAEQVAYVASRWFLDGDNQLTISESTGDMEGPKFLRRYHKECVALGRNSLALGEDQDKCFLQRYTVSSITFFGATEDEDDKVTEQVDVLVDINQRAEAGEDHGILNEEVKDLKGIGRVSARSFYSIAVHTGLLKSNQALKESMEAKVNVSSAWYKCFADQLNLWQNQTDDDLLADIPGENSQTDVLMKPSPMHKLCVKSSSPTDNIASKIKPSLHQSKINSPRLQTIPILFKKKQEQVRFHHRAADMTRLVVQFFL